MNNHLYITNIRARMKEQKKIKAMENILFNEEFQGI